MTLRTLNRFWERRLCEIAVLVSGSIVLFYIWARFIPTGSYESLGTAITDEVAAAAGALFLLSTALTFWLPKSRQTEVGIVIYILTVVLVGALIISSGETNSPFLALWMGVALLSGLFGPIVIAGIASIVIAYLAVIFFLNGTATQDTTSMVILAGILPCIASYVLWGRRQNKTATHDEHSDLAHRLSSVEGKSDIVINAIDDGVLALNTDGVIELINPAAQSIIGWNQGDALGLSYKSVLKLEDTAGHPVTAVNDPVQRAISQKKTIHDETLQVVTNGDKKRLLSLVASTHGKSDTGVIVVFRDITKEKAEERGQAEFISTASHEMRTPVAAIEGYLGLALNPATAEIDTKARDYISKAQESAKHLGRLFQDLLDVSRAEDGRLNSEPRPINIISFVGEIVQSLKPKADEKQLQYHFVPNEDDNSANEEHGERTLRPIYYADVDPDHLREVIANLTENAIKYTPRGEVSVDVTGTESTVTIIVRDSGIGIPAEDVSHLFQKFYRVDNSDTREIGGTGLGLYLCRRLAEAMSGRIYVESEYKKGSQFFLELPRMNSEEATRQLEEREKTMQQEDEQRAASHDATQHSLPTEETSQVTPTAVTSTSLETPQDSFELTQSAPPVAPEDITPAAVYTPEAPSEIAPVTQQEPETPVVTPAETTSAQQPSASTTTPHPAMTPPAASPTLADIERNAAAYAKQYMDTAHARHRASTANRNPSFTIPERREEK